MSCHRHREGRQARGDPVLALSIETFGRWIASSLTLLAMTMAFGATPSNAQAYQCRMDSAPAAIRPAAPDGEIRRLPVTHYTLALSWSPEHCRARKDSARDAAQCAGRNGRFGLIVHGLWPEGRGNIWPQWCPTPRQVTPSLARRHMCMTPSAQLLAHEGAKHGSCMTSTPEAYFKAAQILWDSLLPWLPDYDRLSRKDGLTAADIRRAFAEANIAWKPEMIGVDLNRRGWLEEIRLCYGRDFMPVKCTRQQFGAQDNASAKIWRGL
jgi:ribonuclease T2